MDLTALVSRSRLKIAIAMRSPMMSSPEMPRDHGRDAVSRSMLARPIARIRSWIVVARNDPVLLLVRVAVTTVCAILLYLVYRGVAG